MGRNIFKVSEVIAYLEDKILMNIATEDEITLYEEYTWNNKLSKNNYTYKRIVKQMRRIYEGSF